MDDTNQTPLDSNIFFDDRALNPNEFTYLQTIDFNHIGEYKIKYRAYFELYQTNFVESEAFVVEILSACPQPLSVTPSSPIDLDYTITDLELSYKVPSFSVEPSLHCQVTYTAKVTDQDGVDYSCPDCFDIVNQIFTFHHDADIDVSGPVSKLYQIEITGSSGYLTAI